MLVEGGRVAGERLGWFDGERGLGCSVPVVGGWLLQRKDKARGQAPGHWFGR